MKNLKDYIEECDCCGAPCDCGNYSTPMNTTGMGDCIPCVTDPVPLEKFVKKDKKKNKKSK